MKSSRNNIVIYGLVMAIMLSGGLSIATSTQTGFLLHQLPQTMLEHTIWYVDDDGNADFTKIQDAIDAAESGDIIIVYQGTYVENLRIRKSIEIIGEDAQLTIVDGNNAGNVIYIEASMVTLKRFTIKNTPGSEYDGIVINKEAGGLIEDINIVECIISDNNNGITVRHRQTDLISISHCTITNNDAYGIYSDKADIEKIYDCDIKNNGEGIHLLDSSFTAIISNRITSNEECGIYIDGTDWVVNGAIFMIKNHIAQNNGPGIYFHGPVWIVFISKNNILENSNDLIRIEISNFNNLIYMNMNYWDPEGDGTGISPRYTYWGRIGLIPFPFVDNKAQSRPYDYMP